MKQQITRRAIFICKSMLWSLLLYVTLMLAIYRDEIGNAITGKQAIAAVHISGTTPVTISDAQDQGSFIKSISAILKTISGFASASAGI